MSLPLSDQPIVHRRPDDHSKHQLMISVIQSSHARSFEVVGPAMSWSEMI
jgi:hypothetical protein